jgi:hypothetical protein
VVNPAAVAGRVLREIGSRAGGEAVVAEGDFDGWADLGAQRRAEDEMLVQRYAAGEGRGLDMRPVRGFVQHVRRDIGPRGIISAVKMTMNGRGHEIVVWYRLPQDGTAARPRTASDVQATSNDRAPSTPPGGLASLARSAAAPPSYVPGRPAPGTAAGAAGAVSAP